MLKWKCSRGRTDAPGRAFPSRNARLGASQAHEVKRVLVAQLGGAGSEADYMTLLLGAAPAA